METTGNDVRMQGVLDRLERILAAENAGIGTDPEFDVRNSNIQKSRCLYELSQLSRNLAPEQISPASAKQLAGVRALLGINATRLHAHVEAMQAVTRLLKEAMQAAEADGTYSIDQFTRC